MTSLILELPEYQPFIEVIVPGANLLTTGPHSRPHPLRRWRWHAVPLGFSLVTWDREQAERGSAATPVFAPQ